jgi:rhodanese-related sulfurtransferase
MGKICISCDKTIDISEKKIYKSNNDKLPLWKKKLGLKTHFPNNAPPELKNIKIKHQKKWNTVINIDLGSKYKNRYVLYFAAKSNKKEPYNYKSPEEAYGNYNNGGIAKFNSEGKCKLYISCPQNYKEKNVWYPHIHFLITDKGNNKWIDEIYTKVVLCDINKKQLKQIIKSGDYLILNALPYEYYIKDHIPNSYSLPNNIINKVNEKDIIKFIKDLLINYPKLINLVNKKLDIKNIPIIVYCYDHKCGAGLEVIEYLWNIGFKNIKHYKDGIVDWLK